MADWLVDLFGDSHTAGICSWY